jgi:hypothetical protein
MELGLNLLAKYYWRRAKLRLDAWALGLRATIIRLI